MNDKIKKQSKNHKEYSGIAELQDHETSLVRYSTHIVKLINAEIDSDSETSILEFGAGTGFLLEIFANEFGRTPDACEIDPNLVQIINRKGFRCFSDTGMIEDKYSLIYSSNVLEHIENDVEALFVLRDLMIEDGKLVIYVPAIPWLFSGLDEAVGHYRRYTKKDLTDKLKSAGFEINQSRYVDCLGVLASLLTKILGYKSNLGIGSGLSMQIYDRIVFPVSKIVDRAGFKHLIGKNLFIVATKR